MKSVFSAGLALTLASSSLAYAQTYVSVTGDDARDCSTPALACRDFTRAYTATSARGPLIIVLTSGQYESFTISKSISIVGTENSTEIFNSRIDIAAGAEDDISITGLEFIDNNGARSRAIQFTSGRALHLQNTRFRGYQGASYSAVIFAPTGPSHLTMTDTTLSYNGLASANSGAGLLVKPIGSGSARVTLTNVKAQNNVFGVAVDGSGSTGGINFTAIDSVFSSNRNDGLVATSSAGTAPISVTLLNSKSTNNTYGVRSIGSNVTVRLENSSVIGNVTGLSGGGEILSAGNNIVEANAVNGAFTGSIAFK